MTAAIHPSGELRLGFGGGTLRAVAAGSGPPVVLLHGLGGGAVNWLEVAPPLARTRRVLALDLPGHGGSDTLARGATIDDYADAVAAAVEEARAAPALVVGHSFGGHVATRLAARRPELVRGLLLVAPAGIATLRRQARVAIALSTTLRPARRVEPLSRRLAGRACFRGAVLRPWFVHDAVPLSARGARGLLAGVGRHRDVRAAGRALVLDDPRPGLSAVRCPSLVLWGARDRQLPLDDAFAYARGLGAPLRVIAGCGHLPIVERPDAVLDALAALEGMAG